MKKNHEVVLANRRANFKKNRDRNKARMMFHRALRKGIVKEQPCVKCGKPAEAHHPDYKKPLEVIWLCVEHHAEEHRRLRTRRVSRSKGGTGR